jgi:Ca2+-binding EF-hand superfamily protein
MGRCGTIDFREFVSGLALINSSSKEDREVLIFCLFDLDGTRVISRKEMMDTFKMLVQSNQRLAHRSMSSDQPISVDERTEVLAESMTNEIFEDCDLDNNGVLDLDEFR